jgi:hypothetical protein
MLTAYAAYYCHLYPEYEMTAALRKILNGQDNIECSWDGNGINKAIKHIKD